MNRRRIAALCAATVPLLALLAGAGSADAADKPNPIVIQLPSGQSLELDTDPLGLVAKPGMGQDVNSKTTDFDVDLLIMKCGSSLNKDGTISCRLKGDDTTTPSDPGSTPTSPSTPGTPASANGSGGDHGTGAGEHGNGSGGANGSDSSDKPADNGDQPVAGDQPVTSSGGSGGSGGGSKGPGAGSGGSADGTGKGSGAGGAGSSAIAPPYSATAHVEAVLKQVGVAAFALLALIGSSGLAAASNRRGRYRVSTEKQQGSILFADAGEHEFDPDAGGPGDRSRIWRTIAGWAVLDRFSRKGPWGLARRAPLTARIATDGAYLRAIFGMIWFAAPLVTFGLGIYAASDTDGYPVAPSYTLTAVLLVIAVLDATAGLTGVLGFGVGVLVWGPGDLPFGAGLRSFLGLAALWFAIPLIASAARPLRRTTDDDGVYVRDRIGDTIIAALIGGWAVQGAVLGMPGLSGLELPIVAHADALAIIAIVVIVARVGLEEVAAYFFPERLKVVETEDLPEPTDGRLYVAALLRTAVFGFIAYPFIGACWQLWVGMLLFAVPSLIAVRADLLPNLPNLFRILPRGVVQVLFMIIVGSLFARWAGHLFTGDAESQLRNGFVFLSLPGFVLSLLGMVGRDGPLWWKRSLLVDLGGLVVVALSVTWVLQGW